MNTQNHEQRLHALDAVRGFALPEEIFGLPDDQSTLR